VFAAAAAAVGMSVASPAAATPSAGVVPSESAAVVRDGVTQPVYSYSGAIRETVWVEVPSDGDGDGRRDRVAADIVRPREPAAAGRRIPVIMDASPYYRCCGRGNESERKAYDAAGRPVTFPLFYDNYFVPRGYAVVLVDLAGTNRSEGCLDIAGPSDIGSATAVIDWLNGRAPGFRADGSPARAGWASGAVGMIGKSWDGTIANGVAAAGVAGLRTVVPIEAISNWYDFERSFGLVHFPGGGSLASIDLDHPEFPEDDPCWPALQRLSVDYADDTGNFTPFWAQRDFVPAASRVRASVLLAHGLHDPVVQPDQVLPWWQALGAAGVPRKLWLTQVGHVDPFDARRPEWVATLHRWFDRWLYGVPNQIMAEPPVTRERAPGVYVDEPTWPAPAAQPAVLNVGPGAAASPGSLGGPPAPATTTRTFTDDQGQTEDVMVAAPGTVSENRLLFVTPPLASDVRLSGVPEVTIRASVSQATTPLVAVLVDYGPGTRIDLGPFGSGIRNLDTESCWGRSVPTDDACYTDTAEVTAETDVDILDHGWMDAAHHESVLRRDPLVPGRRYTFRLPLLPLDIVVARGHQIGLVLAGTDANFTFPDPDSPIATVQVQLRGSTLRLPVVGGGPALRFDAATRAPGIRPGHGPHPGSDPVTRRRSVTDPRR
jgi:X-Pro dipeptidyl-peptidase